jgi:hypothetical protein
LRRRAFLQATAGIAAARTPASGIVDIGGTRQLFVDDMLLAETSRVSKFQYRPDKHPKNPILRPDRPWETGLGIQISGQSVLYDSDEKVFKMWYVATRGENDGGRRWCYAVSHDGVAWEKPELGLYEFQGSRRNNLISPDEWNGGGYFNVFKNPRDPDPGRRYKALGAGAARGRDARGLIVAFSPDGLRWTEHPANPLTPMGREIADVPTMLGWDARLEKYVYYPRPGHPLTHEFNGNGKHRHVRTVGQSVSDDFIHWSPTRIMLAPDGEDRVDYQYYQLTAAQQGEFYIGFLAVLQTHHQTFDIYLLSSRDGFHWTWIERELPFLGRGEPGSYDAGYLTPSGPIVHDGKVWIYYGAYSGAHSSDTSRLGPNRLSIALATLPAERYVGLLAGPDRATIATRPITFRGSRLMVELQASLADSKTPAGTGFDECEVRAALLDQSGGAIEGFTFERSKRLTESGRQELRWEGAQVGRLEGKPVRIRFELRNAALCAIQFAGA